MAAADEAAQDDRQGLSPPSACTTTLGEGAVLVLDLDNRWAR